MALSLDTLDYVNSVVKSLKNDVITYLTNTLLHQYNPDVNGYTLIFFVPPTLSGLTEDQKYINTEVIVSQGDKNVPNKALNISKFMTFAAIDFTPPQEQLNTDKIASRSGAIPFATEITTSEQVTVTYIDTIDLAVYKFHQVWFYYIWHILEGKIKPSDDFIHDGFESGNYGAIDYAASFYVVKYKPDMNSITYIGKCVGVFPISLPSKELIGQRTANELTTLPFNYLCAAYRGEVVSEGHGGWIKNEFDLYVKSKFATEPYPGASHK